MDDFFKPVKSTNETVGLKSFAEMLNLGGFHLTKWLSSKEEVIEQIPELGRAASVKVTDKIIISLWNILLVSFGTPILTLCL